MDINFFINAEPPPEPAKRPQIQITPNVMRQIFEQSKEMFDFLVKCGWEENEACKLIIADYLKK